MSRYSTSGPLTILMAGKFTNCDLKLILQNIIQWDAGYELTIQLNRDRLMSQKNQFILWQNFSHNYTHVHPGQCSTLKPIRKPTAHLYHLHANKFHSGRKATFIIAPTVKKLKPHDGLTTIGQMKFTFCLPCSLPFFTSERTDLHTTNFDVDMKGRSTH